MTICEEEKERYSDLFESEWLRSRDEFMRLQELLRDVCWFNFEVNCREWQKPWKKSIPSSTLLMSTPEYVCEGGREYSRYKTYYCGPVSEAPALPPEIVLKELKDAYAYMEACREQISAAHDWAPGGAKYEALRRYTAVGRRIFSTDMYGHYVKGR